MDNFFKILHLDALIQQLSQFQFKPDIKIALIIFFFGTLFGLTSHIITHTKYWRERKAKKILSHHFGSEFFGPDEITDSTRYYIDPDYSEIDPSENLKPGGRKQAKQKLLGVLDEILSDTYKPAKNKSVKIIRHVLILADSGMGKTSFLLNYYTQNQMRSDKKRHRLALVPLGVSNADKYINKIDNKSDTILLLDAFDEYTTAESNHKEKLDELLVKCATFKKVVLTCETQFFLKHIDIPQKTGNRKLLPRKVKVKGEWEFLRLYLCAFNDAQIKNYFIRHYRWKFKFRKDAFNLVKKLPMLTVRPMILAYIQDLIDETQQIYSTFQLYDIMVQKWLERESDWIDKHSLFSFSKELAVEIYVNRKKRGMEKLPPVDLNQLIKKIGLSQKQKWKFARRSFLYRDVIGNFKFAHRSIIEFLFVYRFLELNPIDRPKIIFTDMMQRFVLELIKKKKFKGNENKEFCRVFLNEVDLSNKDLNDFNFSEANLVEADLRGTNLLKANLQRAKLQRVNMEGANLQRARLQGAELVQANLQGAELVQANLQGANLRNAILIETRLQGANLREANLQGANLQGFKFQKVNLERANLQGANLRGANFVKTNLVEVRLRKANLVEAYIQETDFQRADLEGAKLQEADLVQANLQGANLQGADIKGANLQGVNLQGANLRNAILTEIRLQGANLRKANLQGVNLQGFNFQRVNLEGANLQGANLRGANLAEANLQGANIEGADIKGGNLQGVNLQGVNLQGFNFQKVNLEGANLQGANLRKANLAEANLQGANLQESKLKGARLRGANLVETNLQGADLEGANLVKANLIEANLQGANIEVANLEGADLEGANLEGANLRNAYLIRTKNVHG